MNTRKWVETTRDQLDSESPRQALRDMPRALTEFGQQINAFPGRLAALVQYTSMSVDLFQLLGGRLLNLNSWNPIRLRRINRDNSKVAVRVARSNRYRGLFS